MIRTFLERLGVIEPRPADINEVRSEAMKINTEARAEIHESRERRAILQLRLENEQRKARQH